jgi:hypothetical protein
METMTEDLPSRADDILDELERSQRSEAVIRMKMVGLENTALHRIARDEKRHQFERDIATNILTERQHEMDKREEAARIASAEEDAARAIMEERAAAHARVDTEEEAQRQHDAYDAERGPTNNYEHARVFALALNEAGLTCQVMGTQAIAGRGQVKDGWVVNYHCQDTEIGVVAAWWGRGHFTAYLEIAGHRDRTEETAALLVKAFAIARQQ